MTDLGLKAPMFSGKAEDWDTWAFKFEAFCNTIGLGEELLGTSTTANAVKKAELQKKLFSRLVLAMEGDICTNMLRTVSAADSPGAAAWAKLGAYYATCQSASRQVHLLGQLHAPQGSAESGRDYCTRMMVLQSKLEQSGHEISDKSMGAYMLAGLGSDYQPMVQCLLTMGKEAISSNTIIQAVEANAYRLELAASNVLQEAAAYASAIKKTPHGKVVGECWYCHEEGHTKHNCPKKQKADEANEPTALLAEYPEYAF